MQQRHSTMITTQVRARLGGDSAESRTVQGNRAKKLERKTTRPLRGQIFYEEDPKYPKLLSPKLYLTPWYYGVLCSFPPAYTQRRHLQGFVYWHSLVTSPVY
jgi:hypothetical protein